MPIRSLWMESITCGKLRQKFNQLRPTTTHFEQFAFRWRSYVSRFCMNKIVCRYCDLRIAKSFRCMYFFRRKTRFRGNASGPYAPALKTSGVPLAARKFLHISARRQRGNSSLAIKSFPFSKIAPSRVGGEGIKLALDHMPKQLPTALS